MASSKSKIYDLVIIGAGMMGSAAAKHASLIPNTSICLLGPDEPKVDLYHLILEAPNLSELTPYQI